MVSTWSACWTNISWYPRTYTPNLLRDRNVSTISKRKHWKNIIYFKFLKIISNVLYFCAQEFIYCFEIFDICAHIGIPTTYI